MYSAEIDHSLWQGRSDAASDEYVFQTVKPLSLEKALPPVSLTENQVALLGFQSDEGVLLNQGRPGAKEGPNAFRKAFAQLPLPSCKPLTLYDTGNILCKKEQLDKAQKTLAEKVNNLLSSGLKTIIIGGGHETAWGHFQGIHQYFQKNQLDQNQLAILNFDAHFDCRPLVNDKNGSSGTPFYQINSLCQQQKKSFNYFCAGIQPLSNTRALFDYAHNQGIHYLLAESIRVNPLNTNFIEYIIDQYEYIYVSICLDVFHASEAPGVSAPQILGICPDFVIQSLKMLRNSEKVISLDIAELSPQYDIDNRTAKLAAILAAEYLL